ncbi:hypothetical protein [Leifsonia sp. RAF41]|uniref:hypothetical protein n=1 Tax=Leifsonia sp. RAF41 TaxID=3233056 RepID=UPI003F9B9226
MTVKAATRVGTRTGNHPVELIREISGLYKLLLHELDANPLASASWQDCLEYAEEGVDLANLTVRLLQTSHLRGREPHF